MNKLVFASVISEIEQSNIFMTAKARICEAPAANLNGARVTEAFINEIVDNQNRYAGLPLYADVRSLTNGNYRRLGHLYDSKTGEFHSTQIGSFEQFEKEEFDGGCYLVGYARIPKRNRKISKAISELFADGSLKFSFEVNVGEYDEMDDGTIQIDAAETNYLEGTAIVSFPACEDAVALQLVAQQTDATKGGEGEMLKNKKEPVLTAEVEEVTAEETTEVVAEEANEAVAEVATEEVAETTTEETTAEEATEATVVETAETSDAPEEQAAEEIAQVSVYETHVERHDVEIYDQDNGQHAAQTITIETRTGHQEEGNLVQTDDGVTVAEEQMSSETAETVETAESVTAEDEVPTETQTEGQTEGQTDTQTNSADGSDGTLNQPQENKKTAEQLIAELAEVVNTLRQEVAELKESKKVVAEAPKTYNLLMADIKAENKYGLLEKETRTHSYSLLDH